MLQFLPIFAQRVQRKVEKMNRKGVKMRQDKSFKPFMQFLKRLCLHFQDISETRHVREDLLNYLNGSEVRLGDTLAELLRSLVSCNSRAALATALIAVAKDGNAQACHQNHPVPTISGQFPTGLQSNYIFLE